MLTLTSQGLSNNFLSKESSSKPSAVEGEQTSFPFKEEVTVTANLANPGSLVVTANVMASALKLKLALFKISA